MTLDREQALDTALGQIERQFGKGSVMRMSDQAQVSIGAVSTGSLSLDLALGIGGTTAVFGIARPLLLDPLPYANADQVVTFWMSGWWTEEEYLFLRDKFSGFTAVGAQRPGDVTMRDGDAPSRLLPGRQVTANLFDVLRVLKFGHLDEGIDDMGRFCHCSYGWQARDEAAEEALARFAEQAAVDGGVWGDAS